MADVGGRLEFDHIPWCALADDTACAPQEEWLNLDIEQREGRLQWADGSSAPHAVPAVSSSPQQLPRVGACTLEHRTYVASLPVLTRKCHAQGQICASRTHFSKQDDGCDFSLFTVPHPHDCTLLHQQMQAAQRCRQSLRAGASASGGPMTGNFTMAASACATAASTAAHRSTCCTMMTVRISVMQHSVVATLHALCSA